ncbi:MAG: L-seryl-tRNA(Sec) selenium transferase [Brevefilum sp.]
MPDLSQLPSIDQLLQHAEVQGFETQFGRTLTIKTLRSVLNDIRQAVLQEHVNVPSEGEIIQRVKTQLASWVSPSLIPVINASGVILHTNLGRAPLSAETLQAIQYAASDYSNLEFNLDTGKRGKRSIHASRLLSLLTDTEGGFVVNNNAGAVLLALAALAKNKQVLVSRTQLVEIGGGFRIPDVMRQSGAHLLEVGTTNRVHMYDYENAFQEQSIALVLVAHHSNFKLIGFHSEPTLKEVVDVAHQHNVPVLHDVGSGALLDTAEYGLAHEPMVQESVAAGCDLVCFSGDKLVGGPQAGIIIGREALLESIRIHPLARALRADKLALAGITANLLHYLKDEVTEKVPVWRMISRPLDEIKSTAENWQGYLSIGEVVSGFSTVGGGSLPTEEMPTFLLALSPENPDTLMRKLRQAPSPIIARIEDNRVLLDPRTVLPEQEAIFLRNLLRILEK